MSGNIKKVNHGPVVTLNEFEPAAGVKVSKIINLSDDIARNTSSESARISTVPGSNTVGIELPNSTRENVYLSEILNNSDFKKKEIKNLIQEDLPFIKADEIKKTEIQKFKLPSLDLLKIPSKKERENSEKNQSSDPEFLEKILLDFGVNGKIKKISHGPVVTLNEFEPAAGVKVSKIINLSDDIARNTSSESARIAVIPGSSSVGIESVSYTHLTLPTKPSV